MTAISETKPPMKPSSEHPILRINRLNYIRVNAKVLDSTEAKLKRYLQFASEQMKTKITNDDVIEYALNLLFERDSAFKIWSKTKS